MTTAPALAASGAPSSPPPAPAAAYTAANPVPRIGRPIAPTQFQLAEYATQRFCVTLPHDVAFADCLDPTFWANVADRVRVSDIIYVYDTRGTMFGELLVRGITRSNPVAGTRGGVLVYVLRHHEFAPVPVPVRVAGFDVRYLGPAQRWCVVRVSDSSIVQSNLDSREEGERYVSAQG